MLSTTLSMTGEGTEFGKNPLVTKLMKGIYNKKPPLPKYGSTWDPLIVLSHFNAKANGPGELSILKLARKLATLLATVYSAHSVRGAAATKAVNNGVPIQSILNQGHWASESTFARFYKRVIPSNDKTVGSSILRTISDSEEA